MYVYSYACGQAILQAPIVDKVKYHQRRNNMCYKVFIY